MDTASLAAVSLDKQKTTQKTQSLQEEKEIP